MLCHIKLRRIRLLLFFFFGNCLLWWEATGTGGFHYCTLQDKESRVVGTPVLILWFSLRYLFFPMVRRTFSDSRLLSILLLSQLVLWPSVPGNVGRFELNMLTKYFPRRGFHSISFQSFVFFRKFRWVTNLYFHKFVTFLKGIEWAWESCNPGHLDSRLF